MSGAKSQTEVKFAKEGLVATITFSSPNGINILSSRVVSDLGVAVEKAAGDPHLRFVVLRSDGKVFLAGADISEMGGFDEERGRVFAKNGHHVFDALESLPQVTFAAINGAALGGGGEVSLACDFRLMVAGAKIGQPETKLGLIPGWGGTLRLPRVVGLAHARKLIYSGEPITAEEAHRIGLVDEVVPTPADLDAALQRWFKLLIPASPAAIVRVKHALQRKDEIEEFAKCFSCSDAREGLTAFQEKRPASWVK